jgi:type IV secretory pathway VirJ component
VPARTSAATLGTSGCRTVARPGGAHADEQPEELVRSTLEVMAPVPGDVLACEV